MRNFKLTLEYLGNNFSGWQTQAKGIRTIQNHIEEILYKIFKKKIHCHASGRTDSGVHAVGQVAHFKVDTSIALALIHKALNSFLDKDVAIVKIEEVPLNFHAQQSVKQKTYQYIILNRLHPSPLWHDRAYYYPERLNVTAMRHAAKDFKGTHDFKSFQSASSRSNIQNTIRTISQITVTKHEDLIYITVTSNGFLYKMVRNIVGALIEVGSGVIPKNSISGLLKAKNRLVETKTAPSHGLCLIHVEY